MNTKPTFVPPGGGSPDKSSVFSLDVVGEWSFVRVGPRSISLGRGEDVINWDRAGRPFAGNLEGVTWHRALDGRLVEIVTARGGRHARWMDADETARWGARLSGWAAAVCDAGRAHDAIAEAFTPAAAFDDAAWAADAARFHDVYRPVSILPPDQYLAAVLQPAIGCSWNRCTFCDLYRDRTYRVRSKDEFREHALAVRDFFGAGLGVRRSIFLGDANAIATPAARVLEWLEVVRALFPVRVPGGLSIAPGPGDPPSGFAGIHAFLDVPAGVRHTRADWAALAEAGLTTVFLGLETGHDALLALLGKPGSAADARALVEDLKAAGLDVGVIVLTGVGGRELAEAHERDTAALVDALPLAKSDLVYVSPYREQPGTEYRAAERAAGLTPQTDDEAWEQAARLRARMTCLARPDGPRAAVYDVALFAY